MLHEEGHAEPWIIALSEPPTIWRTQLLDGVWGRDVYVDERTVDVHIGRLRKSINRGKEKDLIRTVRGAGAIARRRPRRLLSSPSFLYSD
jgi:DNA-binding response OmpR family regulator